MASKTSGGMISTGAQHQGARVRTTTSPKRNTNGKLFLFEVYFGLHVNPVRYSQNHYEIR